MSLNGISNKSTKVIYSLQIPTLKISLVSLMTLVWVEGCSSEKVGKVWGISPGAHIAESHLLEISPEDSQTRIGDGFDMVSGSYRETCLDADRTIVRTYPVKRTYDDVFVAASRSELARHLQIEPNLEFSATKWGTDLKNTAKFKILRENDIHSTSFIAIAYSKYIRDEVAVYDSMPALSSSSKDLLLKGDSALFRRKCGDKFVKSVETGSSLYLVFRAERVNESYHSKFEIENTLKVALGGLWGVGGGITLNHEQKQILNNYRISTKCYSEGTSAHPCSNNMLNSLSVSLSNDEWNKSILERISAAKMALSSDVDSKSNFVVLNQTLNSYEVPEELGSKDPHEVFLDYRPMLSTLQEWLKAKDKVQRICREIPEEASTCSGADKLIDDQLDACSTLHPGRPHLCRSPTSEELRPVYDLNSAGSVILFEHGGGRGRAVELRFDDIYGIEDLESTLHGQTLYRLSDQRFSNGFEDIVSSFRSDQLKGSWQIVLYEHPDGSGRQEIIPAGLLYGNVAFNDKASAFKLQRAPR